MAKDKTKQNNEAYETRPPVVVVMGHVDHGKTSLLDFIRKTKVAEKETGGITQHIGAYQVEHAGKKTTFIDTPGHEAFYAMRSRGAKVADIAVLVVAADDGIMPQTREAIKHIKQAGIPMIVAINKMDRPGADPMKVKNQLLEEEVVVEDYKGDVPSVAVSAKTGLGVDELLEMINLVAEVAELKADTSAQAQGVVIEAELDHRRGPVASVIVKQGVLAENAIVSMDSAFGTVKILENFLGEQVDKANPGDPVVIIGLNEVPQVGQIFKQVDSMEVAQERTREKVRKFLNNNAEVIDTSDGKKIMNVVLKSDVEGTLEALHHVLKSIESESINLRFLNKGVGEIMESDIKMAAASKSIVVGFRTKINQTAEGFARQMKVEIISSDIIYELVEAVRSKMNELASEEKKEYELGQFKVLAIFRTEKSRMIVGGKVTEGELKRGARVRVSRNEEIVGAGRIAQLKSVDKAVEKIEAGKECGVLFDGQVKVLVGDVFQAYEIR